MALDLEFAFKDRPQALQSHTTWKPTQSEKNFFSLDQIDQINVSKMPLIFFLVIFIMSRTCTYVVIGKYFSKI